MRLCVRVGGFVLNVGGIWRVTNHAGGMGGVSADKKVPIFPFPFPYRIRHGIHDEVMN
jgi:hypothetical protein